MVQPVYMVQTRQAFERTRSIILAIRGRQAMPPAPLINVRYHKAVIPSEYQLNYQVIAASSTPCWSRRCWPWPGRLAMDGGLKPHSDIDSGYGDHEPSETTRRALINDLLETSATERANSPRCRDLPLLCGRHHSVALSS